MFVSGEWMVTSAAAENSSPLEAVSEGGRDDETVARAFADGFTIGFNLLRLLDSCRDDNLKLQAASPAGKYQRKPTQARWCPQVPRADPETEQDYHQKVGHTLGRVRG